MRRLPSHLASLQRLLDDAITVELIAESLYAVDGAADSAIVAADLEVKGYDECGVRRDGAIREFVRAVELNSGTVGEWCHVVPPERIVAMRDPLWSSMESLALHGSLYLDGDSGLDGIVTTADLNKQPARLLMFGIVSMLEMTLLALIRSHYEKDSWQRCLKEDRIAKAEKLHKMRQERKEEIDLADCLQLSDKVTICMATDDILGEWNLSSRRKCQKLFSTLGQVRDNLAHAQSPATDGDWPRVLNALRDGHTILELSVKMLNENG